jgi:predicted transcriptional regulator of viral defense system
MPPEPSPRRREIPPALEDKIIESRVLRKLVALHPVQVSVSELVRTLADDPEDFGESDRVKMAVRELADVGLLHKHDYMRRPDSLVVPTRVALYAFELIELPEADDLI